MTGVPLIPLRLGIGGLRLLDLCGERRRGDGVGQDGEAGAAGCLLALERLGEGGEKFRPLGVIAAIEDVLRAIRIVEVEQRALRDGIGAAFGQRVIGIAVNLDGAEGVGFYE